MVAEIPHGAKDLADPFIVADVVANEIGVSHGGTLSRQAGSSHTMTKEMAFPCRWLSRKSECNWRFRDSKLVKRAGRSEWHAVQTAGLIANAPFVGGRRSGSGPQRGQDQAARPSSPGLNCQRSQATDSIIGRRRSATQGNDLTETQRHGDERNSRRRRWSSPFGAKRQKFDGVIGRRQTVPIPKWLA
jgi:hypothetical protein